MNPCIFHQPLQLASNTLTLLIHGLESSKQEWLEVDGYTKGGNLTKALEQNNLAYVAFDLYGHGEWNVSEPEFDPANISDELWPVLVERSLSAITSGVKRLCDKHGYDSLNIISYSAGSLIAVKVAAGLTLPVQGFFLAAPTPEREYDDEYSLHNNLACLQNSRTFLFYGEDDEYSPRNDVEWLFDQINGRHKALHRYPGGHSLPSAWVKDALNGMGLAETEHESE